MSPLALDIPALVAIDHLCQKTASYLALDRKVATNYESGTPQLGDAIASDDADIRSKRYLIVVDLDKTLILTNTLHGKVVAAIFTQPTALVFAAPKMLRGRAALKASLVSKAQSRVNSASTSGGPCQLVAGASCT